MRRALSLGLAALLVVGVIAAVLVTRHSPTPAPGSTSANLVVVHGVIGSEKVAFFQDPQVQAEFAKHGLKVVVDAAGSRQIASTVDLSMYDFAFPSGAPAADQIKKTHKVKTTYTPFFTPMAIATFKPIVALLVANGVAHLNGDHYELDVAAYLKLVQKGTRWTELPGNSSYPANKAVLITSTDVRQSNSAAMYLAIASYVANSNNVVQDSTQVQAVLPVVGKIFLEQGYVDQSSAEPFNDYLTIGIGKAPMVLIYESQFRAAQAANDGTVTSEMVLMYPSPDTFSKHVVVPLTANGDQVGQLLTTDPVLQQLAVQYGFRTQNAAFQHSFDQSHHLSDPPSLINVVDTPTYDQLELMITGIDKLYTQTKS